MSENNNTMFELESELKLLAEEYEKLHSSLIKAEADKNESEIKNLLSKIHSVAQEQAEIKEELDELR